MVDQLYDFFRGASGLALLAGGLSFRVDPRRNQVYSQFGMIFIAAGCLFMLSALDPILKPQIDLSNSIMIVFLGLGSVSLYRLVLYVFGDSRFPRLSRHFCTGAAIWSALLVVLPFLDYLFGFEAVHVSIEDGNALGPFHWAAYLASNVLPILAPILALATARWSLGDLGASISKLHGLLPGTLLVMVPILLAGISMVTGDQGTYRLGHSMLQFFLLAWYLALVANPHSTEEVRETIEAGHNRTLSLGDDELHLVEDRFRRLAEDPELICDPELNLARVADRIGIPAYRLSVWFNNHVHKTFPEWVNERRVALVCSWMEAEPGATILDLALRAGYQSKSTFNTQFRKVTGKSPREWKSGTSPSTPGT